MNKFLLTAVLGLSIYSSAAHAQTVYSSTSAGTGFTYVGAQHYMEDLTLAGTGPQLLTGVSIALNFAGYTAASPEQSILFQFYSSPNTDASAATTNALATSLSLGSVRVILSVVNGDQVYPLNISSANIVVPAGVATGFVVSLLQEDGDNNPDTFDYSDFSSGRFSTSAPTVGTNVLGSKVWVDGINSGFDGPVVGQDDFNNVFSGPEQTSLSQSSASIRVSITAVPEPSSLFFSGIAGCLMLGTFIRLRNARAAA